MVAVQAVWEVVHQVEVKVVEKEEWEADQVVQEGKAEAQQERVDQVAHRKAQARVVAGRIKKKAIMVKNLEGMEIKEKIKTINRRIP